VNNTCTARHLPLADTAETFSTVTILYIYNSMIIMGFVYVKGRWRLHSFELFVEAAVDDDEWIPVF